MHTSSPNDLQTSFVFMSCNSRSRSPRKHGGPSPRCRNAGCSRLARCNALRGEEKATFDEESHTYTIDGVVVQRSTTRLVEDTFEKFDSQAIVVKYYNSWKVQQDIRYWGIIQAHVCGDGSINDGAAMQEILQKWAEAGAIATRLGTELHLYVECVLNSNVHLPPGQNILKEARQFDEFLLSQFVKENELAIFRTELIVWFKMKDVIVSAGQIDAVFKGREGYYIFDWKRVKPEKDLTSFACAFKNRTGFGPASNIPDTYHHRYSLQLSIYARMLYSSYGLDVGNRLYILRMHDDLSAAELVHCTDLREIADEVLSREYHNLLH